MVCPSLTRNIATFFLVLLFSATGCSWFQSDPDKLPPITMEGKNTFGCLFNGEVWKPKGFEGYPNLSLVYLPNYHNGSVQIKTYKRSGSKREYISLGMSNFNTGDKFALNEPNQVIVISITEDSDCYYTPSDITFQQGELIILEINTEDRFIAGTFEFTLATAECDTIRVTQGRFDLRY